MTTTEPRLCAVPGCNEPAMDDGMLRVENWDGSYSLMSLDDLIEHRKHLQQILFGDDDIDCDGDVHAEGLWHLHAASETGICFKTGYLDGAGIDEVMTEFRRVARPVLELAPFGLSEIGVEVRYT